MDVTVKLFKDHQQYCFHHEVAHFGTTVKYYSKGVMTSGRYPRVPFTAPELPKCNTRALGHRIVHTVLDYRAAWP